VLDARGTVSRRLLLRRLILILKSMIIEQTVDIPADRRIFLDLPEDSPAGKAKITVTFEADKALPDRYAALENLRGIAKRMGSTLTVEQFLAMRREDLELEEAKYRRHFPARG
jgi:hypothetical protein